jgi:hypothetical protein
MTPTPKNSNLVKEGDKLFEGITENVKEDITKWFDERFKYRKGCWIGVSITVINED